MMRWPLALKAFLAIGGILLLSALAQGALIRWALGPEIQHLGSLGIETGPLSPLAYRVRPRIALALVLPLLLATAGSAFVVAAMARRRAALFVEALRRVAAGDYRAELPQALEKDFLFVRDAFDAMRKALDRAMGRLAHADAQRRRLFADLAHELATPTSSILGLSDALATPVLSGTPEQRKHLVGTLEREAVRLERFISDVRDLANLDDPDIFIRRERVGLGPIVHRVVDRLNEEAAEQGRARIVATVANASAMVDETRMEQAVRNLLANAQRYTPPQGTIEVRLESDPGLARITVDDSGEGVPEDLLPRLGERLLRVDPSRDRRTGRHGLGLSIVAATVDRHEGSLVFSRSPLGGLRAEISLPALTREDVEE